MTLKELQKMINADLVFRINIYQEYYCMFSHAEFKESKGDVFLQGIHGNGDTVMTALLDYCNKISGKLLVYKAMSEERLELQLGYITPE